MTTDPSPAAALADGARRGRIEAKARTAGTADRELEQLRAERDRLAAAVQQGLAVAEVIEANGIRWAADSIRRALDVQAPSACDCPAATVEAPHSLDCATRFPQNLPTD